MTSTRTFLARTFVVGALLPLCAAGGLAQEPPRPPQLAGDDPAPLLASDGQPVQPGRIPEGTPAAAVQRWERLLAATRGAAQEPVRAFDLAFEAELRREDGFNQVTAAFRYLDAAPRPFLAARFLRSGRELVRGPAGEFLLEDGRVEPLTGRQWAEDRDQLNEFAGIARNFAVLTRPEAVRLVSLATHDPRPAPADDPSAATRVDFDAGEPLELPDVELAAQARELDWLEVASPDFRLYETPRSGRHVPVFRARLGLDRASGEVRMAVLNEDRDGTVVIETALLVLIRRTDDVTPGYRVPGGLEVRRVDPSRSPWTFEHRAGVTLWLKGGGRINPPDLEPDAFRPPR